MGTVHYIAFGRDPEVSLKKDELAKRLGCTPRHVEKLFALGMPSRMSGRCRVAKETECRNWLAEQERSKANAR